MVVVFINYKIIAFICIGGNLVVIIGYRLVYIVYSVSSAPKWPV